MSSDEPTGGLDGVKSVLRQYEQGSNWVERRDAADALTLTAREIILALRRGAEDKDPDVSHASRKALETLKSDQEADPAQVETEIAATRRTLRIGRNIVQESATDVPTPEDIKGWLLEFAESKKTQLKGERDKFTVTLQLRQGRTQKVYIDIDERDSSGEPIILLYTVCGPPRPEVYAKALQSNARLSHSAFALLKQGKQERLILVNRRRQRGLTSETLAKDLLYLAKKGDEAETQLHEKDVF